MKIYSYMASGKAILATDIASHSQVLTPAVACLRPPDPVQFAAGMSLLISDPALRATLGAEAAALARSEYSMEAFDARVCALYDLLERPPVLSILPRASA